MKQASPRESTSLLRHDAEKVFVPGKSMGKPRTESPDPGIHGVTEMLDSREGRGEVTPGPHRRHLDGLGVKPMRGPIVVSTFHVSQSASMVPTTCPSSKYQMFVTRDGGKERMTVSHAREKKRGPRGSPCCTPCCEESVVGPQKSGEWQP